MGKVLETAISRTSSGRRRPERGQRTARAAREVGGYLTHRVTSRPYFFNCATIAFAWAANWPDGASLR